VTVVHAVSRGADTISVGRGGADVVAGPAVVRVGGQVEALVGLGVAVVVDPVAGLDAGMGPCALVFAAVVGVSVGVVEADVTASQHAVAVHARWLGVVEHAQGARERVRAAMLLAHVLDGKRLGAVRVGAALEHARPLVVAYLR